MNGFVPIPYDGISCTCFPVTQYYALMRQLLLQCCPIDPLCCADRLPPPPVCARVCCPAPPACRPCPPPPEPRCRRCRRCGR